MSDILKVSELEIFFNNKNIVKKISFELCIGERIAILGPSGCGKTSILKAIMGLINFNGTIQTPLEIKKSMMFQDNLLQPWLKIRSIITLPLLNKRNNNVENWLTKVGLENYSDYYPWQLSGGMKRRVCFIRALINNPNLLLLDEPFFGIDELTKQNLFSHFMNLLNDSSLSLIIVTHNIQEAIYFANKIYYLSELPCKISKIFKIDIDRKNIDYLSQKKELMNISLNIQNEIEKRTN